MRRKEQDAATLAASRFGNGRGREVLSQQPGLVQLHQHDQQPLGSRERTEHEFGHLVVFLVVWSNACPVEAFDEAWFARVRLV